MSPTYKRAKKVEIQTAESKPKRRPIKRKEDRIDSFFKAVVHYNKFKSVKRINKQLVVYEDGKKIFAAFATMPIINGYILFGKKFNKITFRWNLRDLDLEQNVQLLMKLEKVFGKEGSPLMYKRIMTKIRRWNEV